MLENSTIHLLLTDLSITIINLDFAYEGGMASQPISNVNTTVIHHLLKDHPFSQGIVLMPSLLRPKSRGSVTLSGPSIDDPPIIDANYLDHPDDVRALVEGMKFLKKLEDTEAFKEHGLHLRADQLLCGDHHEPLSEAYYECYVREYIAAGYHSVGTCSMGPTNGNSVVDPRLRVHGIGRLRVVDASIMPRVVGANTNAACVMIGEKGAAMILEDMNA